MISLKLRVIREKNRIYTIFLKMLSLIYSTQPRVYLFHDIVDNVSLVKSKFSISKASLEYFITQYLNTGFKVLTEDKLNTVINHGPKGYERSFIISFDDVNESVFTKAYPFLKANNVPFIVFITWQLLDKPNFLTTDQLIELSKDPLCIVGCHGYTHKMFRYHTTGEAHDELIVSRRCLEELIGRPISIFAFPYGRVVECSRENLRQVKAAGYSCSFSAMAGTLNPITLMSNYFLPRINVDETYVKQLKL